MNNHKPYPAGLTGFAQGKLRANCEAMLTNLGIQGIALTAVRECVATSVIKPGESYGYLEYAVALNAWPACGCTFYEAESDALDALRELVAQQSSIPI